jgi:hypothetical protein
MPMPSLVSALLRDDQFNLEELYIGWFTFQL